MQQKIQSIQYSHFHECTNRLRSFFISKGFVEYPTQMLPSILATCEDPSTIGKYTSGGTEWALAQTGQMWLKYALLTNPDVPGFFCTTTSYRDEPNPTPGRHLRIFPMFEFETHGGMDALRALESELLEWLGFGPAASFVRKDYQETAKEYGVTEISGETELKIGEKDGPVCFLENFPVETSPFWNMRMTDGTAHKIDVLLHGMETIGSAERSTDPTVMRDMFNTISDGQYRQTLYNIFGEDRVEAELTEFLSLPFIPRCGGGIGVTRLMRAMQLSGLFTR